MSWLNIRPRKTKILEHGETYIWPSIMPGESFQAEVQRGKTRKKPVVSLHRGYGAGSWFSSLNGEHIEFTGQSSRQERCSEKEFWRSAEDSGLLSLQLIPIRNCQIFYVRSNLGFYVKKLPQAGETRKYPYQWKYQECTWTRKRACSQQPNWINLIIHEASGSRFRQTLLQEWGKITLKLNAFLILPNKD